MDSSIPLSQLSSITKRIDHSFVYNARKEAPFSTRSSTMFAKISTLDYAHNFEIPLEFKKMLSMIQNISKIQLVFWFKPQNRSALLCNKDSLVIRFCSDRVEGVHVNQSTRIQSIDRRCTSHIYLVSHP